MYELVIPEYGVDEFKEMVAEAVEMADDQYLFDVFWVGETEPVVRKVEYEENSPAGCVGGYWFGLYNGNDATGDGSYEKPFATIARAKEQTHADQA